MIIDIGNELPQISNTEKTIKDRLVDPYSRKKIKDTFFPYKYAFLYLYDNKSISSKMMNEDRIKRIDRLTSNLIPFITYKDYEYENYNKYEVMSTIAFTYGIRQFPSLILFNLEKDEFTNIRIGDAIDEEAYQRIKEVIITSIEYFDDYDKLKNIFCLKRNDGNSLSPIEIMIRTGEECRSRFRELFDYYTYRKGVSSFQDIALCSSLTKGTVNKLYNFTQQVSKEVLIKLSIGLGLNANEAKELLMLHGILFPYSGDARDILIAQELNKLHNTNSYLPVEIVNETLTKNEFDKL